MNIPAQARALSTSWKAVAGEVGMDAARTAHVSALPSPFNPGAPAYVNMDCGPASVLMALRSLNPMGAERAGIAGPDDAARGIELVRSFTGGDHMTPLYASQLADALGEMRIPSRTTDDVGTIIRRIGEGHPAIVGGDIGSAGTWYQRMGTEVSSPTIHFVFAQRDPQDATRFIVNDPNSLWGPLRVTEGELRAYAGSPYDSGSVLLPAADGTLPAGSHGVRNALIGAGTLAALGGGGYLAWQGNKS